MGNCGRCGWDSADARPRFCTELPLYCQGRTCSRPPPNMCRGPPVTPLPALSFACHFPCGIGELNPAYQRVDSAYSLGFFPSQQLETSHTQTPCGRCRQQNAVSHERQEPGSTNDRSRSDTAATRYRLDPGLISSRDPKLLQSLQKGQDQTLQN